jgi:fluoroquinolone resistance protein
MAEFASGQQYENDRFMRLVERERVYEDIDFVGCAFDHCTFTECVFSHCSFTECRFQGCDLSLVRVPGTRFTDVRFVSSKLIGIDWTKVGDAVISKLFVAAHFDDCLLSYASFYGLTLRRGRFVGCIARDVDFRDADLTDATCTGTDFTGSKFHHTNLTKADFRQATGYAVNPITNTVTKARFSLPEAISLLSGFDVLIE